ncbi:MAG: hypothetical protein H6819_11010 [Phycisphaerales bacterium]|nr:hypothetical protein [Phycisphaerales bacterium]MCB9855585.1 hypothetical protein [Phycisphaerales bacterium]
MIGRFARTGLVRLLMLPALAAFAATANAAQDPPTILQYFESGWDTIRYRMPDVFMAGYDGTWLPPVQKATAGTSGVGYDLFDRFDLGSTTSPTRYGTESGFRLMVDQSHRANVRVYVDFLLNHNSFPDITTSDDPFLNNGNSFWENGGYPGFALELPGDAFGDFHAYSNGCPQSTNPNDGCYNLYDGRLLGLIDIDQSKGGAAYEWIRHPVAVDADNIPMLPGAVRNQPDPANAKFYPDTDLPAIMPNNPGTSRNPNPPQYTFYPFNTADPAAGDAVPESASRLLLRTTKYYLEVLKVDGFRLDAIKHTPEWFFDNLWDAAVYGRYVDFDGVSKTPYSFGEAVEGNSRILDWVRKPGENGGPGWPALGWEFGNRDALDLNEAGQLRDIISAGGFGNWNNVLGASVDNADDGFNNGTVGVHHVTSHDNSFNLDDTVSQAYVLMRPGPAVVYHNALEFGVPGFPAPDSRLDAIGLGGTRITTLVKIRNQYGRGFFFPLNSNRNDVLAFTRRSPSSEDNVLVGLNDSNANGFDSVSITTAFPAGTRLHELTGNAASPIVDPNGDIPELITVGAGGVISNFRVPRNSSTAQASHRNGYVIYGPAVPTGTLSIANATTIVAPPDSASTPDPRQRVNPVTIVTSSTFDILLQTQQTDPSDPNTDDAAVFRIDSGFVDHNGNGGVDHTDSTAVDYGFEDFLTENSPRFGGGTGTYRQTIDASQLGDGYHYITVRAYRHRPGGTQPLFGEFRIVIFVDNEAPAFQFVSPTATCDHDVMTTPVNFVIEAQGSVDDVYVFLDRQDDTNFEGLAMGASNRATRFADTFTLTRSLLTTGNHRVDIVAVEVRPDGVRNTRHETFTGVQSFTGSALGVGDLNADGAINGLDVELFVSLVQLEFFLPTADTNCDGLVNVGDISDFATILVSQ